MEFKKLIGLKIVAIRGHRTDMRKKSGFSPEFIMFDDGKTYIEIVDQDYYAYHDCDGSAKQFLIWQSEEIWKSIMDDKKRYPDADMDISRY